MTRGHYILEEDGKTPKDVDLMTWGRWMENDAVRRVGDTTVADARVSTVFLGLDHQFDHGDPLLWETMIFGGDHDGYCDRYSSHDAAVFGHQKAVEIAEGKRER